MMIRRRAHNDDGYIHIWINDAVEHAEETLCGTKTSPSPDESGRPCRPCIQALATAIVAKLDDEVS